MMSSKKIRQDAVFISGFPNSFDAEVLRNYLDRGVGECDIEKAWQNELERMFIVIRFNSFSHAATVVKRYNNSLLFGSKLRVSYFREEASPVECRRYTHSIQKHFGNNNNPSRHHGEERHTEEYDSSRDRDPDYHEERGRWWEREQSPADEQRDHIQSSLYRHDKCWRNEGEVEEGVSHPHSRLDDDDILRHKESRGHERQDGRRNWFEEDQNDHERPQHIESSDERHDAQWNEKRNMEDHDRQLGSRGDGYETEYNNLQTDKGERYGEYELSARDDIHAHDQSRPSYYDNMNELQDRDGGNYADLSQSSYYDLSDERENEYRETQAKVGENYGRCSEQNQGKPSRARVFERNAHLDHHRPIERFKPPYDGDKPYFEQQPEEGGNSFHLRSSPDQMVRELNPADYDQRRSPPRHPYGICDEKEERTGSWDCEWNQGTIKQRGFWQSCREAREERSRDSDRDCRHGARGRCRKSRSRSNSPPRYDSFKRSRPSRYHPAPQRPRGLRRRPRVHPRDRAPPRSTLVTREQFLSRNIFEDDSHKSTTSDDANSSDAHWSRRRNESCHTHTPASRNLQHDVLSGSDRSAHSSGHLLCDPKQTSRDPGKGVLLDARHDPKEEKTGLRSVVQKVQAKADRRGQARERNRILRRENLPEKGINTHTISTKRSFSPSKRNDPPVKRGKVDLPVKRIIHSVVSQKGSGPGAQCSKTESPCKCSGLQTAKREVRVCGAFGFSSPSPDVAETPLEEADGVKEDLPVHDLRRLIMSRRQFSVTVVNTDVESDPDVILAEDPTDKASPTGQEMFVPDKEPDIRQEENVTAEARDDVQKEDAEAEALEIRQEGNTAVNVEQEKDALTEVSTSGREVQIIDDDDVFCMVQEGLSIAAETCVEQQGCVKDWKAGIQQQGATDQDGVAILESTSESKIEFVTVHGKKEADNIKLNKEENELRPQVLTSDIFVKSSLVESESETSDSCQTSDSVDERLVVRRRVIAPRKIAIGKSTGKFIQDKSISHEKKIPSSDKAGNSTGPKVDKGLPKGLSIPSPVKRTNRLLDDLAKVLTVDQKKTLAERGNWKERYVSESGDTDSSIDNQQDGQINRRLSNVEVEDVPRQKDHENEMSTDIELKEYNGKDSDNMVNVCIHPTPNILDIEPAMDIEDRGVNSVSEDMRPHKSIQEVHSFTDITSESSVRYNATVPGDDSDVDTVEEGKEQTAADPDEDDDTSALDSQVETIHYHQEGEYSASDKTEQEMDQEQSLSDSEWSEKELNSEPKRDMPGECFDSMESTSQSGTCKEGYCDSTGCTGQSDREAPHFDSQKDDEMNDGDVVNEVTNTCDENRQVSDHQDQETDACNDYRCEEEGGSKQGRKEFNQAMHSNDYCHEYDNESDQKWYECDVCDSQDEWQDKQLQATDAEENNQNIGTEQEFASLDAFGGDHLEESHFVTQADSEYVETNEVWCDANNIDEGHHTRALSEDQSANKNNNLESTEDTYVVVEMHELMHDFDSYSECMSGEEKHVDAVSDKEHDKTCKYESSQPSNEDLGFHEAREGFFENGAVENNRRSYHEEYTQQEVEREAKHEGVTYHNKTTHINDGIYEKKCVGDDHNVVAYEREWMLTEHVTCDENGNGKDEYDPAVYTREITVEHYATVEEREREHDAYFHCEDQESCEVDTEEATTVYDIVSVNKLDLHDENAEKATTELASYNTQQLHVQDNLVDDKTSFETHSQEINLERACSSPEEVHNEEAQGYRYGVIRKEKGFALYDKVTTEENIGGDAHSINIEPDLDYQELRKSDGEIHYESCDSTTIIPLNEGIFPNQEEDRSIFNTGEDKTWAFQVAAKFDSNKEVTFYEENIQDEEMNHEVADRAECDVCQSHTEEVSPLDGPCIDETFLEGLYNQQDDYHEGDPDEEVETHHRIEGTIETLNEDEAINDSSLDFHNKNNHTFDGEASVVGTETIQDYTYEENDPTQGCDSKLDHVFYEDISVGRTEVNKNEKNETEKGNEKSLPIQEYFREECHVSDEMIFLESSEVVQDETHEQSTQLQEFYNTEGDTCIFGEGATVEGTQATQDTTLEQSAQTQEYYNIEDTCKQSAQVQGFYNTVAYPAKFDDGASVEGAQATQYMTYEQNVTTQNYYSTEDTCEKSAQVLGLYSTKVDTGQFEDEATSEGIEATQNETYEQIDPNQEDSNTEDTRVQSAEVHGISNTEIHTDQFEDGASVKDTQATQDETYEQSCPTQEYYNIEDTCKQSAQVQGFYDTVAYPAKFDDGASVATQNETYEQIDPNEEDSNTEDTRVQSAEVHGIFNTNIHTDQFEDGASVEDTQATQDETYEQSGPTQEYYNIEDTSKQSVQVQGLYNTVACPAKFDDGASVATQNESYEQIDPNEEDSNTEDTRVQSAEVHGIFNTNIHTDQFEDGAIVEDTQATQDETYEQSGPTQEYYNIEDTCKQSAQVQGLYNTVACPAKFDDGASIEGVQATQYMTYEENVPTQKYYSAEDTCEQSAQVQGIFNTEVNTGQFEDGATIEGIEAAQNETYEQIDPSQEDSNTDDTRVRSAEVHRMFNTEIHTDQFEDGASVEDALATQDETYEQSGPTQDYYTTEDTCKQGTQVQGIFNTVAYPAKFDDGASVEDTQATQDGPYEQIGPTQEYYNTEDTCEQSAQVQGIFNSEVNTDQFEAGASVEDTQATQDEKYEQSGPTQEYYTTADTFEQSAQVQGIVNTEVNTGQFEDGGIVKGIQATQDETYDQSDPTQEYYNTEDTSEQSTPVQGFYDTEVTTGKYEDETTVEGTQATQDETYDQSCPTQEYYIAEDDTRNEEISHRVGNRIATYNEEVQYFEGELPVGGMEDFYTELEENQEDLNPNEQVKQNYDLQDIIPVVNCQKESDALYFDGTASSIVNVSNERAEEHIHINEEVLALHPEVEDEQCLCDEEVCTIFSEVQGTRLGDDVESCYSHYKIASPGIPAFNEDHLVFESGTKLSKNLATIVDYISNRLSPTSPCITETPQRLSPVQLGSEVSENLGELIDFVCRKKELLGPTTCDAAVNTTQGNERSYSPFEVGAEASSRLGELIAFVSRKQVAGCGGDFGSTSLSFEKQPFPIGLGARVSNNLKGLVDFISHQQESVVVDPCDSTVEIAKENEKRSFPSEDRLNFDNNLITLVEFIIGKSLSFNTRSQLFGCSIPGVDEYDRQNTGNNPNVSGGSQEVSNTNESNYNPSWNLTSRFGTEQSANRSHYLDGWTGLSTSNVSYGTVETGYSIGFHPSEEQNKPVDMELESDDETQHAIINCHKRRRLSDDKDVGTDEDDGQHLNKLKCGNFESIPVAGFPNLMTRETFISNRSKTSVLKTKRLHSDPYSPGSPTSTSDSELELEKAKMRSLVQSMAKPSLLLQGTSTRKSSEAIRSQFSLALQLKHAFNSSFESDISKRAQVDSHSQSCLSVINGQSTRDTMLLSDSLNAKPYDPENCLFNKGLLTDGCSSDAGTSLLHNSSESSSLLTSVSDNLGKFDPYSPNEYSPLPQPATMSNRCIDLSTEDYSSDAKETSFRRKPYTPGGCTSLILTSSGDEADAEFSTELSSPDVGHKFYNQSPRRHGHGKDVKQNSSRNQKTTKSISSPDIYSPGSFVPLSELEVTKKIRSSFCHSTDVFSKFSSTRKGSIVDRETRRTISSSVKSKCGGSRSKSPRSVSDRRSNERKRRDTAGKSQLPGRGKRQTAGETSKSAELLVETKKNSKSASGKHTVVRKTSNSPTIDKPKITKSQSSNSSNVIKIKRTSTITDANAAKSETCLSQIVVGFRTATVVTSDEFSTSKISLEIAKPNLQNSTEDQKSLPGTKTVESARIEKPDIITTLEDTSSNADVRPGQVDVVEELKNIMKDCQKYTSGEETSPNKHSEKREHLKGEKEGLETDDHFLNEGHELLEMALEASILTSQPSEGKLTADYLGKSTSTVENKTVECCALNPSEMSQLSSNPLGMHSTIFQATGNETSEENEYATGKDNEDDDDVTVTAVSEAIPDGKIEIIEADVRSKNAALNISDSTPEETGPFAQERGIDMVIDASNDLAKTTCDSKGPRLTGDYIGREDVSLGEKKKEADASYDIVKKMECSVTESMVCNGQKSSKEETKTEESKAKSELQIETNGIPNGIPNDRGETKTAARNTAVSGRFLIKGGTHVRSLRQSQESHKDKSPSCKVNFQKVYQLPDQMMTESRVDGSDSSEIKDSNALETNKQQSALQKLSATEPTVAAPAMTSFLNPGQLPNLYVSRVSDRAVGLGKTFSLHSVPGSLSKPNTSQGRKKDVASLERTEKRTDKRKLAAKSPDKVFHSVVEESGNPVTYSTADRSGASTTKDIPKERGVDEERPGAAREVLTTAQFEQRVRSILQKRMEVEKAYKEECASLVNAVKILASRKANVELELQEMLKASLRNTSQKYINELATFVRHETN